MIAGTILLERAESLEGAVAEVRLRASALEDAPAATLASTRIACPAGPVREIGFALRARVERGRDYALAAEVRRSGGDRLQPGDLLTTAHRSWTTADRGDVTLAVRAIS